MIEWDRLSELIAKNSYLRERSVELLLISRGLRDQSKEVRVSFRMSPRFKQIRGTPPPVISARTRGAA